MGGARHALLERPPHGRGLGAPVPVGDLHRAAVMPGSATPWMTPVRVGPERPVDDRASLVTGCRCRRAGLTGHPCRGVDHRRLGRGGPAGRAGGVRGAAGRRTRGAAADSSGCRGPRGLGALGAHAFKPGRRGGRKSATSSVTVRCVCSVKRSWVRDGVGTALTLVVRAHASVNRRGARPGRTGRRSTAARSSCPGTAGSASSPCCDSSRVTWPEKPGSMKPAVEWVQQAEASRATTCPPGAQRCRHRGSPARRWRPGRTRRGAGRKAGRGPRPRGG